MLRVSIPQASDHNHDVSLALLESSNNPDATPTPSLMAMNAMLPIPKRNLDTGKFKNIAELANEITGNQARN